MSKGMSPEKVLEVIEIYRQALIERNIGKAPFPPDDFLELPELGFEHCHYMLDVMVEFINEGGRMEKVFRWLGFVQGVLWVNKVYTITEIKNFCRPNEKKEGIQ